MAKVSPSVEKEYGELALSHAIEFIRDFVDIDAVFDSDVITTWVAKNVEPDSVFDDDTLIEWVADNCNPEQVFKDSELRKWAEDNGYTKE